MKPLSNRFCSCDLSSFSYAGTMRYGALEMGPVPGSSSILKFTARNGGIPRRSSGKTSVNSFTMGTVSIVSPFLLCLLHKLESLTPLLYEEFGFHHRYYF